MKRILSLFLAVVIVLSMFAGLQISSSADTSRKASSLSHGDTFTMGRWPQSEVKDSSLLSSLNALSVKLYSYGYKYDVKAYNNYKIVNMYFGDVAYGGEVYRKVVINQYRPYYTDYSSSLSNSYQDNNVYTTGNTYWFRWEPIKWRVLAKENDGVYVLSDIIIDSQPYNDVWKAITWEECTLRAWLNQNFYQSAFSPNEKSKVLNYYHNNEKSALNSSISGGANTTDKVWVLSYSDAINSSYGFSSSASDYDAARKALSSEYAKSQGLLVNSYDSNSYWWLRSPGYYSPFATSVYYDGHSNYDESVHMTSTGVRPTFKLNLSSSVSLAEPAEVGRIFHGSILSGKVTGVKCAARTVRAQKFTWNAVKGVNGYQIQLLDASGKAVKNRLKATKTNVYTYSDLKVPGYAYKVRVRAFIKVADNYYFGLWSAVLTSPTLPNGTSLTGLARAKKAFTAKWKKGACTGYQLQLGRKANFAGAKTVTFKNVKTVKYTAKKLAANKYYFVRIRTYKRIAGKNYFSKWSKTYRVKTK